MPYELRASGPQGCEISMYRGYANDVTSDVYFRTRHFGWQKIALREGCDTSGNLVRSGRNQLEIIGNQLEITEIWLEIRNQDPVEIRKCTRNPREITRNTPFLSEHAQ